MEDEPLDRISEISEMPVTFALGHFLAALCWGTLAGTGAMIAVALIVLGFDVSFDDFGEIIAALWFIGLIVGAFTLAGLVIIGLPLTLGLKQIKQESVAIYASIGALAGFMVIALVFEAYRQAEAFWLAMIGALAGGICAYRWGLWRERIALAAQHEPVDKLPAKQPNPIHDLLH